MNYERIYCNIIESARNDAMVRLESKRNGMYFERHHVTPRCLGGDDSDSNLVLLTPEEHYVCH